MNETFLRVSVVGPLLGVMTEELERLGRQQKLERLEAAVLADLIDDEAWEEDLARAFASEP